MEKWPGRIMLLLLIALIASVLYWTWQYRHLSRMHPVAAIQSRTENPPKRRASDLRELLKPSTEATPPITPPADPEISSAGAGMGDLERYCQADWRRWAETSQEDLTHELQQQRLRLSENCAQATIEQANRELIREFVGSCLTATGLTPEQLEEDCLPLAPIFRAWTIQQLMAEADNPTELSVSELSNQLVAGFLEPQNLTRDEVHQNIKVAQALIEKDPNVYAAYKAQLINWLILELKYGEEVPLETYDALYDEMLGFEGVNRFDEVLAGSRFLDVEEGEIDAAELRDIDRDLIHIPFIRLSALGDDAALAAMAEDYIDAFPDSYIGYFYLAEAAWKAGDRESSLDILRRAKAADTENEMLYRLFQLRQSTDPLQNLYNMEF